MAQIYLGLGSNIGPRTEHLRKAELHIEQYIGQISKASSDYETEPWGITDQAAFINNVIEVQTFHNPHIVLSLVHKIEYILGRQPTRIWGERSIDIDILFYEDLVLKTDKLTLPHPFIEQRNFVLEPMKEINHTFIHPMLKKTIEELYLASLDHSAVRIIGK